MKMNSVTWKASNTKWRPLDPLPILKQGRRTVRTWGKIDGLSNLDEDEKAWVKEEGKMLEAEIEKLQLTSERGMYHLEELKRLNKEVSKKEEVMV